MEDRKDAEARKYNTKTHPYLKANILSKICFTWIVPLFRKGFKRDLEEDDLYPALSAHDSTYLGDKLEREWEKEVKNKKDPSLWKALMRVFGKQVAVLGVAYLIIEVVIRLSQPLALSKLLDYYDPDSKMSKEDAYLYSAFIVLSFFASVVCQHTYMLHIFHLGMKIRVATSTIVYRKALKLSKSALAETTVGQMVNLISNDVGRFELATTHMHNLWLAPLETIVVLILLYFFVGPTGLAGVCLMLAFIPFQMWMGKKTSIYRLGTALRTDERIRLMNEIISGIQVIKMYTWEKPFAKLVEISRWKEIQQIRKISVIRAIMMSFNLFLSRAAIYLCMMTYVLTGNILTAQYVFVTSSFYAILRNVVTMFFPQGITQLAESSISVKRIKQFLMYEEVEFDSSATFLDGFQTKDQLKKTQNGTSVKDGPIGVHLKNVSVQWLKKHEESNLQNITMEVSSGELAAVIGPVGSGKTTLLHAILKELPPTTGTAEINGRISYASQEPWLFVGSVRQNITFGQEFDSEKYQQVVRVCALERDFSLFPYGDRTIVGERGVSLSGGQRARINLARAVYKDADIYLLDDPLSAVDTHVGKHLFEECISGYLKNKCVVLVTHQLQYLKNVEKIYLFGHHTIENSGTYEEIQKSGTDFTKLLEELKDVMDEDESEEEDAIPEADLEPVRRRRKSTKEVIPKNDKDPSIEKEGRGQGTVALTVYKSYVLAGGHWCKIIALFVTFVVCQVTGSLIDYYLTWWVNIGQLAKITTTNTTSAANLSSSVNDTSPAQEFLPSNDSFAIINDTYVPLDEFSRELTWFQEFWLTHMTQEICLSIYSCLVISVITLTLTRSLWFYRCCMQASVRLHNNMFEKIVYATMRFFNTNPSGRILNRFSKDMNQVDEVLPMTLLDTTQICLMVSAIILVISTVNPWMLIPAVVILIIFYSIRVVFLRTSRDLKRLEGVTRSPVYSHLTASLQGLTTIRAFGAQEILKVEFDNYQNKYSSAYFMFVAANRCFGFWLDMHCVLFITLVTFSFLLIGTETFGGTVGLAITQSFNLTGMLQWGMRQWSELENTMTCVERIKEYADVTPESDEATQDPPKNWPEEGNLKFENLSLRYAATEPLVLKSLNFSIKSKEKIGIVGRTGAGKSSIIAALFRLSDIEGRILIDNVDTKSVPLNKLRSKISIIPQEPVLFSGTLRKNLDPFDEYSDEVLWNALEEVELRKAVSELPQGLESKMSEGGSNFSVGQRQLVCLARAIVRNNKILVLDEATANVDPHTDSLIQSTIRRKFSNCTVLTVAHRLHTIMDADKVLVMDAGKVVEFAAPHELLQNKEFGVLYELVQQTGKAMADNLMFIAEESYRKSQEERERNSKEHESL
ncbi:ATP-binding cassette subfamily C member 4-like [Cylas formicarius]|uniref:ATP-binding cassette subfamily C member 4-like n=1 Tax=Cylas formicarius TaxID=197179 RepID=UPI002958AACB|nr:ATP-binding cassette subfamily C member 4-like [Cylas formicarius]